MRQPTAAPDRYCVFGGSKKAASLTSPTTFQSDTILPGGGMVIRRPIRVYSNIGPQLAAKRPAVSWSRRRRSPRRPRPHEVALSHPTDAFHRPPTPTGTRPHTTGGYTPANTRQQCQNIGGAGQETAGGCRRSRGAGWRSGSPVDCCRGHGAALATEMSTRRAFGGRPREPAASVRRSEAQAADGGWARRRGGAPAGAAARWRPWQQTHLPCPQAGRRGQGRR